MLKPSAAPLSNHAVALVRDLLQCPGKCPMPSLPPGLQNQFTDGKGFALRKVFDELVSTLVSLDAIDVRQRGQRGIQRMLGEVDARMFESWRDGTRVGRDP